MKNVIFAVVFNDNVMLSESEPIITLFKEKQDAKEFFLKELKKHVTPNSCGDISYVFTNIEEDNTEENRNREIASSVANIDAENFCYTDAWLINRQEDPASFVLKTMDVL